MRACVCEAGLGVCSHSPDVMMTTAFEDDMPLPICIAGLGCAILLMMAVPDVTLVLRCAGPAVLIAPGDGSPGVMLICACAERWLRHRRFIMVLQMAKVADSGTCCDSGTLAQRGHSETPQSVETAQGSSHRFQHLRILRKGHLQ